MDGPAITPEAWAKVCWAQEFDKILVGDEAGARRLRQITHAEGLGMISRGANLDAVLDAYNEVYIKQGIIVLEAIANKERCI